MIRLELEFYCHEGCTRFAPQVLRFQGTSFADTDTIVSCEHAAECQYMLRYLKEYGKKRRTDE